MVLALEPQGIHTLYFLNADLLYTSCNIYSTDKLCWNRPNATFINICRLHIFNHFEKIFQISHMKQSLRQASLLMEQLEAAKEELSKALNGDSDEWQKLQKKAMNIQVTG